ncbi:MAG: metallophosphoesterase family protein [Planctomycetota bacterium]
MRVGVISDTHDLLRPEAVAALREVEVVLHAGDVCRPEVLAALRELAPLHAVRGNCDRGDWAAELPRCDTIELGAHLVHMVHRQEDLDLAPEAAGISVVIFGHTHEPKIEQRRGVFYLNPGSAGPRRFGLPITLALLDLTNTEVRVEHVPLTS